MINNQKSMAGIESKSIARLQPIKGINNPLLKVPHKAPNELIDPIQESCSFVKGPVFNGVSSDKSSGREGDKKPNKMPCIRQIKFAEEE